MDGFDRNSDKIHLRRRSRRRQSIRARLFAAYAAIIVVTIVALALTFWIYTSRVLSVRTTASLESLTSSLTERLDEDVRAMDTVSLGVAFAGLRQSAPGIQTLASILGPFQTVRELYIHSLDGTTWGAGLYTGTSSSRNGMEAWNSRAWERAGSMYLSLPHPDVRIGNLINIYQAHTYVSLSRVFYDTFGKPLGVVEVEQDAQRMFSDFGAPGKPHGQTDIVVFNRDGGTMFQSDAVPSERISDYYKRVLSAVGSGAGASSSGGELRNAGNVLAFSQSAYSGLTVVAIEPEAVVFAPVITFERILFFGGLLAILAVLLISYDVARRVTIPIRSLHDAILRLNGERLFATEPLNVQSNLNELEELNLAFSQMHVTLRESVQDLITLRSHEALTKLLAFQSQMRPHFLYNTLANISVMAEERMNDRIVKLCSDLSAMYRYLGEGFSNMTTLRAEIEFTRNFLACMEYRYDGGIDCAFAADLSLLHLQIPRLTVQPLVENVLKYGVAGAAAVTIRVSAVAVDDRWQVNVSDNGPGFSDESLCALREQMRRVETNGGDENVERGGIGLRNIYARLRILYGEGAMVEVDTNADGGASVTIGGLTHVRFGA